ncbi:MULTISPECIES: hypothetical protein [Sphingobium]|uniref:Uncharacterized protein n=1 Tax=Sphingobium fuliginis (strain ATCC 27551) TaxID=336203 RepID=A0A292ZDN8_SPHSA|nr:MULTISPECIES: hypothetical protein [Sphingobium]AJR25151.1 hypothetical protein TZ53_16875 [Sphingobium sp. YBL2]MCB4862589.1 hypothetical protein [Sphingobium sp. PNB]QOT72480.1 hypothetical protein H5V43_04900 [Sphingobium fuliginis]RYL97481.1 hypothetical protein EWH10_13060 [Sphingobium fuliginis]WDA37416.1 hypothetical protein PO876_04245 [Sphingobium sp. YC-XJ3]
MTQHLKLRIHVSEPFDFERLAGRSELTGWTVDHADPENGDWEVHLDAGFDFHERHIGRLLVSPRYVGEHLARMFDAIAGFPVRIAHRDDGAWHYAFTGMISERHEREEPDNGSI